MQYFTLNSSPFSFETIEGSKPKLKKRDNRVSPLDVVKCCYNFLKSDFNFYKNVWKWSEFFQKYRNNGCDVQKLYTNNILAMLTGMSVHQLNELNRGIPKQLILENEIKIHEIYPKDATSNENASMIVRSSFCSDVVCSIEGVILPIYDASNKQYFEVNDVADKIVDVPSTKTNKRSIALGISSNKVICLTGPVGCGKTTLVEYLAKLTGRIPPLTDHIAPISYADNLTPTTSNGKSTDSKESNKTSLKRPNDEDTKSNELEKQAQRQTSNNGFLRIQLGDQTDSKMLLGQYRCTDLPGEFVWQPGVLTQV